MLREIYEIGKTIVEEGKIKPEEQFVDKAKLKKTKIVLCITFKKDSEDTLEYIGIKPEEYDESKSISYLYKGLPGSGVDLMPSTLISKDITTAVKKRIFAWFEGNVDKNNLFRGIYDALINEKEHIIKDISLAYGSLDKESKYNTLLTIKIFDGGAYKYLWDYKEFRDSFIDEAKKQYYYKKSMGESKGEGTCYLCGKHKEVYGFVLPAFGFSFSTADKPGFVPGFNKEWMWKEIPICEDCAVTLEVGKKYLDENLSYGFYGNKYYVIPQVVLPEKSKEVLSEIMDTIERYKGKGYQQGLVADEDDMVDIAMEKGNIMKLIFVFYSQKGGGKYIDILKYIENVLPSHMREIYEAEKNVKSIYGENFVKILFGEKAEGDFVAYRKSKMKNEKSGMNNWYIAFGRIFFSGNKEFLNYVGNVLSGKPIDRRYLIARFLDAFRKEFKNKNDLLFRLRVVEAMMIYDFLREMELIRGEFMAEESEEKMKISTEKIEKFFEERKSTFASDEAKAAFLVGALVNYVLQIQRKDRGLGYGDEPFRAKLYGLNIDEKKLRKIFTEAVEKLSEYKRGSKMESVAADYLSRAGNGWKMNRDDISYYFSLGLVLGASLFWEKEENDEGGEKNGSE